MDEEKIIEESLKNSFSKIQPDRASFERLMSEVTSEDLVRNNKQKEDMPSPYQSTYNNFVKKISLIGLPIVALAAYFIFVNINTPKVETNAPTFAAISGNRSETAPVANDEDADVDTIIDSVFADIESDQALAINDSGEDAFIQNELNEFDSLKTNNYEEII